MKFRNCPIGAIGSGLSPGRLLFPKRVGDAIFLQLAVKGGLADAQQLGGLQFVAVEGANGSQDGLAFHIGQGGQLRLVSLDDRLAGYSRAPRLQALLLQLRGQVAQVQHGAAGERAGPFDGIFEFPHVARPVVAHHGAQGLVAQGELGAVLAAEVVQKMRRQQRNVLAPVAERRQFDAEDVQPVIQIRPERSRLDQPCGTARR